MNKDILLSVIVPVYNTDEYLSKCIESIINQTYKKLEILLIDDGSVDKSGEICDYFAQKDNRVVVFHRKHEGALAARKFAVEHVKGQLVTFVDSDDWIECDMYQQLVEKYWATSAQMITSGLIYEYENKIDLEIDTIEEGIYVGNEIYEKVCPIMMYDFQLGRRAINSSTCNKLFEVKLFKHIVEKIDEDLSIGDDAAIIYPFIAEADRIVITHECYYHYVVRKGSLARNYNDSAFDKIYLLKKYLEKYFSDIGLMSVMEDNIQQYIRPFLNAAVMSIYGMEMERISYIFPYDLFPQKCTIVLYGAGKVGRAYWKYIQNTDFISAIAWVDKKYGNVVEGKMIENPDSIIESFFDYILIAIEDGMIAKEIIQWLIAHKIESEKIIWRKPRKVH